MMHIRVNGWCATCGGLGEPNVPHADRQDIAEFGTEETRRDTEQARAYRKIERWLQTHEPEEFAEMNPGAVALVVIQRLDACNKLVTGKLQEALTRRIGELLKEIVQ